MSSKLWHTDKYSLALSIRWRATAATRQHYIKSGIGSKTDGLTLASAWLRNRQMWMCIQSIPHLTGQWHFYSSHCARDVFAVLSLASLANKKKTHTHSRTTFSLPLVTHTHTQVKNVWKIAFCQVTMTGERMLISITTENIPSLFLAFLLLSCHFIYFGCFSPLNSALFFCAPTPTTAPITKSSPCHKWGK